MSEEKIVNNYYQTNIKTSRNEDSVYAMKYASQQMLIDNLQQENQQLKEKVEYLKSKIENKDRWCQLIADIGFDYDGYRDVENLKTLIDELVRFALYSRDDYDYEDFLSEGKNE